MAALGTEVDLKDISLEIGGKQLLRGTVLRTRYAMTGPNLARRCPVLASPFSLADAMGWSEEMVFDPIGLRACYAMTSTTISDMVLLYRSTHLLCDAPH
eukprot:1003747-Rhodomonas_salina.4